MPIKPSRSAFLPLFLIIFIDSMGYFLIIPVLMRLITDVGQGALSTYIDQDLRNFIYGFGVAISPFAYLVAAPIVGSWSDTWGRKKTMLVCLISSCVGFLLPVVGVLAGSLTLILLGRALAGAASSSQPIAQAAVTDISSGKQKAFYLSMIAFAMTLAMILGPLLGGYLSDSHLVHWFNFTTPFWMAALLVFINIVMMLFFFPETHPIKFNSGLLTLKDTWWALTAAFHDKRVRVLLLVFLIYEFAWSLYFQDIALYLSLAHYGPDRIALFIAYVGIWMSLGLTVIYRYVIRYLSLSSCLLTCLIISVVGLIGCSISNLVILQWLLVVPVAIGVGMAYPTLLAILSNQVSDEHQGWIMGVAGSILALSWMLSALITGLLTNVYRLLPLQTAAFAMLLSVIILLIWLQTTRIIRSEKS